MNKFNTKIIAEIGSNHMGNLDLGKILIDKCKKEGCSLVKFQLWRADDLYKNTDIYKTAKKLELSFDMAKKLFDYAKSKNIDLFFSVFYDEAVDFCEELNVKYYKIAARSVNDYNLLTRVAKTKKPIFISFSKQHEYDIKKINSILKNNKVVPLYTISKYPPKLEDFSINFLNEIISKKGGYSNHFKNLYSIQLAIFNSASWIELHVMIEDKCKMSPDYVCSITMKQLNELLTWQNKMKKLNQI